MIPSSVDPRWGHTYCYDGLPHRKLRSPPFAAPKDRLLQRPAVRRILEREQGPLLKTGTVT